MANYYLEFSVLLPVSGLDASAVHDFIANYRCDDPDDEIDFDIEIRPDGVWLHPEEAGSPELAADFIQSYMTHFNINGGIFMSWASYCSKPRINEATGGSVVITKDDQYWSSPYDVVRRAESAGLKIINLTD
jgi:hypothetical protein